MSDLQKHCAVQERTGDGRPVGRCWFHLKNGCCPRHGFVGDHEALEAAQAREDSYGRKDGKP